MGWLEKKFGYPELTPLEKLGRELENIGMKSKGSNGNTLAERARATEVALKNFLREETT